MDSPPIQPAAISAITLVVDDLAAARAWYGIVFDQPIVFEDEVSTVFDFGGTLINLLHASAAPELVDPAPVAAMGAGVRSVITLQVDDVDARCAALRAAGIELLNGPVDRPWGPRTASVRGPDGQVWEFAG